MKITFEGFYDTDSGHDFDMPMFMVSPCVQMVDVGNSGYAENMVEDYFIDWDIDGKKPRNHKGLLMSQVKKDFTASKKKGKRFKYWKAVVEYDPKNLMEFDILEKVGW